MPSAASALYCVWSRRLGPASLTSLRSAAPLCAFNAFIDKRVEFGQLFAFLFNQLAEDAPVIIRKSRRQFHFIDSPQALAALILSALESGKAAKVNITEPMANWMHANFARYSSEAIGGQAGIIANQVAVLGSRPVLYTPFLSPHFASLFTPRVRYPIATRHQVHLLPLSQCARRNDSTRVNWIIEFFKGDSILFGSHRFTAPRSNKIILSSAQEGALLFDPLLMHHLPELGQKINSIIVSGYHKLQPVYEDGTTFEYYLGQQEMSLELLKAHAPLPVHLEYVSPAYPQLTKSIYQHITNHVDSFGLNEVEMLEVADHLGFSQLAREIAEKENAYTLYRAAAAVFKRLKLKRLHLHNLGYHLILLNKPLSGKQIGKQVNAALFASLAATARAIKGSDVARGEIASALDVPLSQTAFDQLTLLAARFTHSKREREIALNTGIFDRGDHYLLLVPGQAAVAQKHVVGLGDTVSACAFLAGL